MTIKSSVFSTVRSVVRSVDSVKVGATIPFPSDLLANYSSRSGLELVDSLGDTNPSILPSYMTKPTGSEYAYINDNGALDVYNTDFTFAMWVKSETTNKTAHRLLGGKAVSASVNGRYGFYALATSGYIYVAIQDSAGTYQITSDVDFTAAGWVSLRLDVKQSTKKIRVFINNVQVGADVDFTGTFSTLANVYRFYIGAQNAITTGLPLITSLSSHSDTIILNRLFTVQEAIDFQSHIVPSDCKAHWPCDSYNIHDVSGNNYHLTSVALDEDNVLYGTHGSRHALNYGYKAYAKGGSKNYYVPYKRSGTLVGTPTIPQYFYPLMNEAKSGDTANHNGADSLIVFSNDNWDRSNVTIFSDTARLGYYDDANPTAWHPSELRQIEALPFYNTNYEGINFIKRSLVNNHILEILSYSTNKTGNGFKRIITYVNSYDSYHTLAYVFQDLHICTQRGAKILTFDNRYLKLSLDGGSTFATTLDLNGVTTIICRSKIYSNGNIMFCSNTKCYYSDDNLATYQEATTLGVDGETFVPAAANNFTPLLENNIDEAGSMTVPDLFGMYSIAEGEQYDNVNVWCTTDYGVTVKSIYKFGVSEPVKGTRHFHAINYNRGDDTWWIQTGDEVTDPHGFWTKFVHNSSLDTWTWELIYDSTPPFMPSSVNIGMCWYGDYAYWGCDQGGLWRCLYADIEDLANHCELVKPAIKGMNLYFDGEVMISYYSDTGKDMYTSIDFGKTWLKTTLVGGVEIAPPWGGYTCCINKNSNGYYKMEIVGGAETLADYTQGQVLLLKTVKL